jgi:phosphoribosyl 1,2-cyclic phosphate phosphodiesterase
VTVAKTPAGIDIRGEMILLGTGTSVGIPTIGCGCPVCQSSDPHNKRTRCSTVLGLPDGNLLIDTPPDLRTQLLRENIGIVHAVAYTHEHADHIFGMDDLRIFQHYLGRAVPVYCSESVEVSLRRCFPYAFSDEPPTHKGARPQLEFHRLEPNQPRELLGSRVLPLRLEHGPRFQVLGFRIGNVAYCTDTNLVPPESLSLLEGLDVLVLDALRPTPHATHFSLEEAVEVARHLQAKQTYFTHISCRMDHSETNSRLPAHIQLAYDGLRIPLT